MRKRSYRGMEIERDILERKVLEIKVIERDKFQRDKSQREKDNLVSKRNQKMKF